VWVNSPKHANKADYFYDRPFLYQNISSTTTIMITEKLLPFALFLLSLAYLGWFVYIITYKRIIPGWMHTFFEHQRQLKPQHHKDGEEIGAVGLLQNLLLLLGVASYIYIIQYINIGFDTENRTINPVLFFIHLAALIAIYWFGGRNLAKHWGYYRQYKNDIDAKDKLKTAYGVTDWATTDDVKKRLTSSK
jgi:hypothetical protein